jgi:Flp pilus assembly protein protease CpaA
MKTIELEIYATVCFVAVVAATIMHDKVLAMTMTLAATIAFTGCFVARAINELGKGK